MKISIVRSRFLDGLKYVQNVVPGKGPMVILQNVLLEANGKELKMTTTDLDISIISKVDCEVHESGSTTLPVKLLVNSISKLSEGIVEISVDENERSTIKSGSARYQLAGLPASDFPKLPEDQEAYEYSIQQATFKEMLRKTAYAASQDDTRRTLKGVLMSFKDQKLTMVATDGRRLAMVENEIEFPKEAEKDIVLPAKSVAELQRALGTEGVITMKVQQSQICFTIDNVMMYSKLMDEVYPNYRQVIPTNVNEKITIDRQALYDALDRASVMTMDESHSTKLVFEADRLMVASAASDIGDAKDEVPIKYAGEKIEIIFNPTYVMDPLKAIDDDEVTINLKDGHSPAVIRCSVPFLYVLMPLRVN